MVAGAATGRPAASRGDRNRRRVRSAPRQERAQSGICRPDRVRVCERSLQILDWRSIVFSRPQRLIGRTRGSSARSTLGALWGGARSLCRPTGLHHAGAGRKPPSGLSSGPGPRLGRSSGVGEPTWPCDRSRRRAGRCAPIVERDARRRSSANPRRFLRFDDEPVALVSDGELSAVGSFRVLPTKRCVRIPRPASGRHGPLAGTGRSTERTPATCGGPAVRGRRCPALVARTERPGASDSMLRRPAVASVCGGSLRPDDR